MQKMVNSFIKENGVLQNKDEIVKAVNDFIKSPYYNSTIQEIIAIEGKSFLIADLTTENNLKTVISSLCLSEEQLATFTKEDYQKVIKNIDQTFCEFYIKQDELYLFSIDELNMLLKSLKETSNMFIFENKRRKYTLLVSLTEPFKTYNQSLKKAIFYQYLKSKNILLSVTSFEALYKKIEEIYETYLKEDSEYTTFINNISTFIENIKKYHKSLYDDSGDNDSDEKKTGLTIIREAKDLRKKLYSHLINKFNQRISIQSVNQLFTPSNKEIEELVTKKPQGLHDLIKKFFLLTDPLNFDISPLLTINNKEINLSSFTEALVKKDILD